MDDVSDLKSLFLFVDCYWMLVVFDSVLVWLQMVIVAVFSSKAFVVGMFGRGGLGLPLLFHG